MCRFLTVICNICLCHLGDTMFLPGVSTVFSRVFFFSSRRRHTRYCVTGVQTCALPILDSSVPEDLAFAESRIRPTTIAAEDLLHDLGAISMIGSDSQAMGRVGEVVIRTWQTAHAMKARRGALPGDGRNDNLRARRYVAKYTICPAVAHGLESEIGSVEPGKLADLVLWDPAFFGVRPHLVLKGGFVAWAAMGDANASIPTPQPVLPRPMWGANATAVAATSLFFVAPAALDDGLAQRLAVRRRLAPVADVRQR